MKRLKRTDFDIILDEKFRNGAYHEFLKKYQKRSWNVLFLDDVMYKRKYKVLVTNHFFGGNSITTSFISRLFYIIIKSLSKMGLSLKIQVNQQYFQKILGEYNVRFMYGADTGGVKINKIYNHVFDEFFCHGPHDGLIVNQLFAGSIFEMGYPRYDSYFINKDNKDLKNKVIKSLGGDVFRPTILWIVTVSEYFSTIEKYADVMEGLTEKYNVVLRPHPLEINPKSSRYNRKVDEIVRSGRFLISLDASESLSNLYLIADYVFCDYGGSIFSALYLNKKIILLDHEDVTKDTEVYGSTAMEIRKYLPTFSGDPGKLNELLSEIYSDGREYEATKSIARKKYFGEHGRNSAPRAARRLMDILEHA